MIRVTLFALLMVAACDKKKDDTKSTPTATTPTESKTVEARSNPKLNGPAVEVCGQIPKDKVEAIIGKTTRDPQPTEAGGSMLGQCTWSTESGFAMVSTRPANEYEGTVEYAGSGAAIPGIGEKAFSTKSGLLVKVPGKEYMLQVGVFGGDDKDTKTQALAKLALETLK